MNRENSIECILPASFLKSVVVVASRDIHSKFDALFLFFLPTSPSFWKDMIQGEHIEITWRNYYGSYLNQVDLD